METIKIQVSDAMREVLIHAMTPTVENPNPWLDPKVVGEPHKEVNREVEIKLSSGVVVWGCCRIGRRLGWYSMGSERVLPPKHTYSWRYVEGQK